MKEGKERQIREQGDHLENLRKENRRLLESMERAKEENARTEEENRALKERKKEPEEKIATLRLERGKLAEEINETNSTLKKMEQYTKELEELNQDLLDRMERRTTKDRRKEDSTPTNQCLLVADSNGREIYLYLSEEWTRTENTFKTEDLQLMDGEMIEDFSRVTILLGTNNIKNGEDGIIKAERYIDLISKLSRTGRTIEVLEIPPINRRSARLEREFFNRHLRHHLPKEITLKRTPNQIEKSSVRDVLKDDLHLNKETAEVYAKEIMKPPSNNREGTGRQEKKTAKTTIPRRLVPEFLGRGGRNVQDMESRLNVRIAVDT